jgi:hypothetical protein
VRRQHDEVRHRLLEREHLGGGLDKLLVGAHAGELPSHEQLGPVGEVADQLQRGPLADVEPGQAVVDVSRDPAGQVRGVGDRGAVLPGVEQDERVGVLDDVGADRPRRRPVAGGEQPPVQRLPGAEGMLGVDLDGSGADDRRRSDGVRGSGLRA